MSGIHDNELVLTAPTLPEVSEAIELFKSQGRRHAVIVSDGTTALAELLVAEFKRHDLPAAVIRYLSDTAMTSEGRDGLFVAVNDPTKLSGLLTRLTRVAAMFVWAPKTRHYFKSRPAFVQSVPKTGTHVVFECLKAFGYAEPTSLDLPHFDAPFDDGAFYNLQHMPISRLSCPYQRFPGFFDSLARSVTVFIVRDPRDTAVSLAHYLASQTNYHLTTALFRRMPTEERVSRVITGEYPIPIYLNRYLNLTGSIRELFDLYLTWWRDTFPNVWRLRYEDLIGASGGGDIERQLRTIWGLQLALNVPGRPSDYNDRIFSQSALTFRRGQIGDYLIDFTQDHHELFERSAADLLGVFGYADRWRIARVFSVMLPATYELSTVVASQLRSEFASHGRDFSAIVIHASGEHNSADFEDHLEVEASRVGDATVEDRITLSIKVCDGVHGAMPELASGDASRYILRVDETSFPLFQVNAIIEALIETGCIGRLSEESSQGQPNWQFDGEIGLLADANAAAPILEEANYWGHNLVRYLGQIYAVPVGLGQINFESDKQRLVGLLRAENVASLRAMVTSQCLGNEIKKEYGTDGATEIRTRLKALEELLVERSRRIASLETTMQERDQRLKGMEQTLEEKNLRIAGLQALEETLGERTQRIAALEATMEERDRRLKALEQTLEEKSQRTAGLRTLEETLGERTQRIASLEATMEERSHRLQAVEKILETKI